MKRVAVGIAILVAFVMLLPLALTISTSFKGRTEALGAPLRVIPFNPTLDNYRQIVNYRPFLQETNHDAVYAERFDYPMGRWFLNSVVIAAAGAATTTISGLMMAFGLSKYRFRLRRVVIGLVVLSIVVPGQVVFVQKFILCRTIGLYNTLFAVIVPNAVSAGSIWFLVQYMKAIPQDFLDMGRLDGLGAFGLLRRVIAPLCMPAVGALLAMYLVGTWNNYLWPLVVLRKPTLYTLILGVREVIVYDVLISTVQNPGLGFAGATLGMAPGLILFLFFQRYMVTGLFHKAGGK